MARILLIEDDAGVRGLLAQTLIDEGYEVSEATNGADGVKLYQKMPADLIITDLVMPEKDGLAVIMELRRVRPHVKIIAISGGGRYRNRDYLKTAEMLGAKRVLDKPFGTQILLRMVKDILEDEETQP